MSQLERFLLILSFGLSAGLIFRLARERLHRVYPWFFAYLCFGAASSLLSLPFDPSTEFYGWIYRIGQPVAWLLYILVVLELYGLILQNHRGIATLGRWTLMVALGVSVIVSSLTLLPELSRPSVQHQVFIYYTVIERGIISSLVVFLLLITVFLIWYPVPLSRNVIAHAVVFVVYFLSSTLALFVRNLTGHDLTGAVSTALIAVTNACLLAWIFLLDRRGEERTVVVRHQWRAQNDRELVRQLDAINAALLRSARK